ncbi:MAG TPA: fibronectin type III domain-containing protein [Isosphaeraceae bacterium]|nr:fibronectin type III domain-containing protein [Isosphaeraceae bacterium]
MKSFVSQLLASFTKSSKSSRPLMQKRQVRLGVECLEGRQLMSATPLTTIASPVISHVAAVTAPVTSHPPAFVGPTSLAVAASIQPQLDNRLQVPSLEVRPLAAAASIQPQLYNGTVLGYTTLTMTNNYANNQLYYTFGTGISSGNLPNPANGAFYIQIGGEEMKVTANNPNFMGGDWTVQRAVNGVLQSHSSDSQITLVAFPPAPTNFKAGYFVTKTLAGTVNFADLSWSPSPDHSVTSYSIIQWVNGKWQQIGTVAGNHTSTTFDLPWAGTYYFSVGAVSSAGTTYAPYQTVTVTERSTGLG